MKICQMKATFYIAAQRMSLWVLNVIYIPTVFITLYLVYKEFIWSFLWVSFFLCEWTNDAYSIVVETLRKRKFNALVRWNVMLLLIHKKHLIPFPLQGIYFHIYYIYLCISVMYPSNMRMQTFIKSHVDI